MKSSQTEKSQGSKGEVVESVAEKPGREELSPMEVIGSFETLGLAPDVLMGAMEAGYKSPTPIQAAAIPLVLAGHDLIAQARTGTGKTAAFGLPAMSLLKHSGNVEILVITPTRELASQVSEELFKLGRAAKVRSVAVYGGQSSRRQVSVATHDVMRCSGREGLRRPGHAATASSVPSFSNHQL